MGMRMRMKSLSRRGRAVQGNAGVQAGARSVIVVTVIEAYRR